MKGTEYKSVTTNIHTQSKTKMTSAIYLAFLRLAKIIADNRQYRDNFENFIDYRDKKNCTDNWQP